jgi:hypothetical protein
VLPVTVKLGNKLLETLNSALNVGARMILIIIALGGEASLMMSKKF